MSLKTIVESFPEGRIRFRPDLEDPKELRLYNAISREPALDPLFEEMKASGLTSRLQELCFEGDWAEGTYDIEFQDAIDLLEKYGPFDGLRRLEIFGESYLTPGRFERMEVFETQVPNVRSLNLSVPWGVGLGRPFHLEHVDFILVDDFYFHELDIFARCSFPVLTQLQVTVDVDKIDDEELVLAAMRRLFSNQFAPTIKDLNFTIFYQSELNDRFPLLFNQAYPELLTRTALEKVGLPEILDGAEQARFEEAFGSRLKS